MTQDELEETEEQLKKEKELRKWYQKTLVQLCRSMKLLDTDNEQLSEKLELAINGREYMEPVVEQVDEKTLKM